MGLFVYTQKGSIISTVDLPTTEIIEPFFVVFRKPLAVLVVFEKLLAMYQIILQLKCFIR